jgi:hypothetical protein
MRFSLTPAHAQYWVALVILVNNARVLYREATSDNYFSEQEICIFFCTRLRSISMAALANETVFFSKMALSPLVFGRGRTIRLQFAVAVEHLRQRRNLLSVVVPTALTRAVTQWRFLRPPLQPLKEARQNIHVAALMLERRPVLEWRALARLAHSHWTGVVAATTFPVYMVVDSLQRAGSPGVFAVVLLVSALLLVIELTRADRTLLRFVLQQFTTLYLVLNVLLYALTDAASRWSASEEDRWTAASHVVFAVCTGTILVFYDCCSVDWRWKCLFYFYWVANAIRVLSMTRSYHAHASTQFCTIYCANLASVSTNCLVNLCAFFARSLVLLLTTKGVVTSHVRVWPLVTVQETHVEAGTTVAAAGGEAAAADGTGAELASYQLLKDEPARADATDAPTGHTSVLLDELQ